MGLLINTLRGHVRDSESAIATLNREVADAIAARRPTDELLDQIRAISETRNFILARLRRLEDAKTQAGARPISETTAPESALRPIIVHPAPPCMAADPSDMDQTASE